MKAAHDFGKNAAHLDRDEIRGFRISQENALLAHIKRCKAQCELELRAKADEEKRAQAEISSLGNVPRSIAIESLFRGIWLCPLLIICAAGEYVFTRWMIGYFGLGDIETHIVSATIVIIFLESFDQYLTAIRKRNPRAEGTVFLIAGSMSVIAVFLLIFLGAYIRKDLTLATSATNFSGTLEETVRQANWFFGKHAGTYLWLMATLTTAFTVVGGVSYHEAKHRIIVSVRCLYQYRRLNKFKRDIESLGEKMIVQDARIDRFRADFETGLLEERRKMAEKQDTPRNKPQTSRRIQNIGPIAVGPLTLLLVALLIFLLIKGTALGAEHKLLLDLSLSVQAKNYLGSETCFEKNKKAIENYIRNRVDSGDRIQVLGITEDSFSRPHTLLEAQFSDSKGAFGENLAREKLLLLNQWNKINLKATAKGTDIFGAVMLAAIGFSPAEPKKNLIIFSDMRQCARGFDIETPAKIHSEMVMKKVEAAGLIPPLNGVTVKCLGVQSSEKTPAYWMGLRDFWTRYFTKAQGKLTIFSLERRF